MIEPQKKTLWAGDTCGYCGLDIHRGISLYEHEIVTYWTRWC